VIAVLLRRRPAARSHLPVEVDTAINRGVWRAMELRQPTSVPWPAMPVGKSNEHISYPGMLTLSVETLIRL
jgi:creatinine amidohydrolase